MSHESTQSLLWFCLDSKPPEFYPPKTSQHFKAIIAPHPFGKLTATELWSCGSSWLWGMCGVCCRAMLLLESRNLKQHVFRNIGIIRTRTWHLLTSADGNFPEILSYSFRLSPWHFRFVSKIFRGFWNIKVSLESYRHLRRSSGFNTIPRLVKGILGWQGICQRPVFCGHLPGKAQVLGVSSKIERNHKNHSVIVTSKTECITLKAWIR